jgi:hypothetical protein
MLNIAAIDVLDWIKILALAFYLLAGLYRMFARGENFRQIMRERYPDLYEKYFVFWIRNPYFHCPGIFPGIKELVQVREIRKIQITYLLEIYAWIFGFALLCVVIWCIAGRSPTASAQSRQIATSSNASFTSATTIMPSDSRF